MHSPPAVHLPFKSDVAIELHELFCLVLVVLQDRQQRQSTATVQSPPTVNHLSKLDLAVKLEELTYLVQVVLQV